jgi:hypothetical protein
MDVEKKVEPVQPTLAEQLTGILQEFAFACSMKPDPKFPEAKKASLKTAIRSMRSMVDIL